MNAQATVQTQTTKPTVTPVTYGLLQRCTATQECNECHKKREGLLQRAAIDSSPVGEVPPIVHEVLRSPGQPLDASTRAYMEPRFGADFSRVKVSNATLATSGQLRLSAPHDQYEQEADAVADRLVQRSLPGKQATSHDLSRVRIHTGAKAAKSANAVNALAYTVGHDIVFGAGQFAPATPNGRRLIGHELAHVVQQSGGEGIQSSMLQREASPTLTQPKRDPHGQPTVPPRGTLHTIRIWFKAFIPDYKIHIPLFDCFLGDNRKFSHDPNATARLNSELLLTNLHTPTPTMNEKHYCDLTRRVDCDKPDKLIGSANADPSGMRFYNFRYPGAVVWDWDQPYPPPAHPPEKTVGPSEPISVDYIGAAADPLIPAAPQVDMWAHISFDQSGFLTVNGKVDDYPAFEGYVTVNEKPPTFNIFARPPAGSPYTVIGGANRPFSATISLGSTVSSQQ